MLESVLTGKASAFRHSFASLYSKLMDLLEPCDMPALQKFIAEAGLHDRKQESQESIRISLRNMPVEKPIVKSVYERIDDFLGRLSEEKKESMRRLELLEK